MDFTPNQLKSTPLSLPHPRWVLFLTHHPTLTHPHHPTLPNPSGGGKMKHPSSSQDIYSQLQCFIPPQLSGLFTSELSRGFVRICSLQPPFTPRQSFTDVTPFSLPHHPYHRQTARVVDQRNGLSQGKGIYSLVPPRTQRL